MTVDSPILTLAEAASLLKVSERWLQRSRCPHIRIGGMVRYDRDVLLEWFRSHLDAMRR